MLRSILFALAASVLAAVVTFVALWVLSVENPYPTTVVAAVMTLVLAWFFWKGRAAETA